MNVAEIITLTSLVWTSAVIGVLTLSVVTMRAFGTRNEPKSVLNQQVSVEDHHLVTAESNVISLSDYRAKKLAKEALLTSKVDGKATRIIYPLKKH